MSDLEQRCADAGLKMTGQRRIILKVLGTAEDHPSVESVYERSKKLDSSISIATVYRTLNMLDELDLVTRHEFKENFSRYETNMDHHHHLIDLESGQVIEFQNAELEALKERIAKEMGYDLIDHRLELSLAPQPMSLTHLRAKHSVLTDQQIIAKRTALEAPWESNLTMDALWQHTRNIVALGAAGNDVIDDAALIAP